LISLNLKLPMNMQVLKVMMLDTVSLGSLSLLYFIHIVLSGMVAAVGSHLLRLRYKDRILQSFLFILLFNIALPFIGYLFSIWLIYYLLYIKYAKILRNTKSINMEELDQEFPTVKRAFGEGSMVDLMGNTLAPQELRMKALSAMADNMTQKNVALIKNSLSEKDDEIRLYSFSLIDKMEHGINNKIHEASIRHQHALSPELRLAAARELAFLYWEMIYFDLSDDILKNFLIEKSFQYAKLVFKENMSDTGINILLGKIYLERELYEEATTQFIIAIESGIENAYIVPYLAELYYNRGNYRSIRSMLSMVDSVGLNATMHPVLEQWRQHG